jgi:hypothetical protein
LVACQADKEQMLQEVEGYKEMKQKEKIELALQRKRERERARKAGMGPAQQMAELKRNAARAQGEFEMQEEIDLVPKDNVTAWVKYLRRELPTVAMKCSTQQQKFNLARSKASGMNAGGDQSGGSECIGGEQLLQVSSLGFRV